jgi:DNA-binding MarR family transcriptional regulator
MSPPEAPTAPTVAPGTGPAPAAAEAAPAPSGDARLDDWRTFLVAHARLTRRLDEELRAEHGLSLAEYDALLQLAQAPDRRLRMSQLAEAVILSRSGVTRLIDRLVADGLVERSHCLTDARGAEAVLTAAGLGRLRRAATTHLRGIDQYFLSVVPASDLGTLGRALRLVAERAGPGWTAPEHCADDGGPASSTPPGSAARG